MTKIYIVGSCGDAYGVYYKIHGAFTVESDATKLMNQLVDKLEENREVCYVSCNAIELNDSVTEF